MRALGYSMMILFTIYLGQYLLFRYQQDVELTKQCIQSGLPEWDCAARLKGKFVYNTTGEK